MESTFAKTLINTAVIVAVAVGIGVVALKTVGPLPLSISQTLTQKQTTFDATGTSTLSVEPDTAALSVGIDVHQPTLAKAKQEANQKMNAVIDEMIKLGVKKEKMKTQYYSVSPEYDYTSPSRKLTGFAVSSSIRIEVTDFDLLEQVIDRATTLGSNQVGGVEFTLSEQLENETKKKAREEAIRIAKENAEELSRLGGMRLGKIVNIIETQGNAPMPYFGGGVMKAMDAAVESAPTRLEPGTNEYNFSVTISYETL